MVSTPKPDPEVKRQQEAARADKLLSIQESVSRATDQLIRVYGARSATGGGTVGSVIRSGGGSRSGGGLGGFIGRR